jgi:ribonucleoside-triphosphate reductase
MSGRRNMHDIDDVYEILDTATFAQSEESDMKRSNANVNTDSPMGAMLTYGSEVARLWVDDTVLPPYVKEAVDDNIIYIHDKDFYGLTMTCCQIDLSQLFEHGFNTGHGRIRPPKSIGTAAALACIAIQSNQNDMFGGQSVPAFDYYLAPYVKMTYEKNVAELNRLASAFGGKPDQYSRVPEFAWNKTVEQTDQAMEALVHNLNTMHSRAGAQVPFSSLNYGTDTSRWGRQVIYSLLKATHRGMGNGETPIFPVQIFKIKEGVNYNPEDPNYDLFQLAMRVSAERLFPNFSFMDSPYNAQYLKRDEDGHIDPDTEVAYMGCRTRVMANVNGPETTSGRGNLSFTSVNLVRCALESKGSFDIFLKNVYDACTIARDQLLHRFEIQKHRHVYNYPFLMGNGVYLDSGDLEWDDEIESALVHGTLSIGFIGLAEAMFCIFGQHHGESDAVWRHAFDTVRFMRDFCDRESEEHRLNFSLLATPAEGLSGKFVVKDKEKFGEIPGVTDKDYYTNSFHVPVYYNIGVAEKIEKEAPFHSLCNAGHITYVELDGDTTNNLSAFETIVRHMHDCGIGYGAINHPVDRDPICGYRGVIYDTCPCCGRKEFEAVPMEKRSDICLR